MWQRVVYGYGTVAIASCWNVDGIDGVILVIGFSLVSEQLASASDFNSSIETQ